VILAFLVQGLRHLHAWKWDGRPVGAFLAHSTIAICVLMVPVQIAILWAQVKSPGWKPRGFEREDIIDRLKSLPGEQLALVRYRPDHDVLSEEWVNNQADIEHAKIILARDMDARDNRELLEYYKDRKVWLVEPDAKPPLLSPYSSETVK